MSDWIQCTNDGCGVWVHTECLDKCNGAQSKVQLKWAVVAVCMCSRDNVVVFDYSRSSSVTVDPVAHL